MYSTTLFEQVRVPYEAIILLEPALDDRQLYNADVETREQIIQGRIKVLNAARSDWESRAAAFEWLSRRFPWKQWDERIRYIYVVGSYPDFPISVVRLIRILRMMVFGS